MFGTDAAGLSHSLTSDLLACPTRLGGQLVGDQSVGPPSFLEFGFHTCSRDEDSYESIVETSAKTLTRVAIYTFCAGLARAARGSDLDQICMRDA